MIKISVKEETAFDHETDCLIIPCLQEKKPTGPLKEIDRWLNGDIGCAFENQRFEGKPNQTLLLNTQGMMSSSSVLLVGVGPGKDLNAEKLRQAAGTASKLAEKSRHKKISFHLQEGAFGKALHKAMGASPAAPAGALAEGSQLALYHFDQYKSKDDENPQARVEEIVLLSPSRGASEKIRTAVDRAGKLAEGVCTARDLGNHPSNKATPTFLAGVARKAARRSKMSCKVLGKTEMKQLGMGSLLGVAQGAHEAPALIILEHHGAAKSSPPVVIVGKGITFDTGGISLKPPANMHEMKMDMMGGAVTIGTLQAAADLKLPINVIGLVPATENMPGGSAIKPGDILTSMSGKTIEVLNTDAEGRLVLADALSYAERYKPRAVIDLATLTGAVMIALGHHAAAVLGNNNRLIDELIESGTETGERLWQLPLWEEYEKAMKSDIADLKNIAGPGVGAGTITGAAFLKEFAGDAPWSHIDIAGTAWGDEKPYYPKGASGFGVRLLINYLEREAKRKRTSRPRKKH